MTHDDKRLVAAAEIATDGSYSLSMRGGKDILTGTYTVSVMPPPPPEMTPEQQQEAMFGGETPPEPEWPDIPKKYRSGSTSGVTFEVKAGANTFDLDMKTE